MNNTQKGLLIGSAVIIALASTAVASSYFTREAVAPQAEQSVVKTQVHHAPRQQVAAAQPCDDNNIIGTVGGAVAGGLVGSQFGKGNGRGLATAGGAVAGGALGNAYLPTRGATCN